MFIYDHCHIGDGVCLESAIIPGCKHKSFIWFRFLTKNLVSKAKAIEIAKYLEENGHVYSTTSDKVFFPNRMAAPPAMVEAVYNFVSNNDSEIGVTDTEIADGLGRKYFILFLSMKYTHSKILL